MVGAMASNSMNMGLSLSPAAGDLGLGSMLDDQVKNETEEQRKRRMQQQSASGVGGGTQSPASLALFGGMGAIGR